jgi:hypothetical protein
MTKPNSIAQEQWDALNEDQKRFVRYHEWLHELFNATLKIKE